MLPTLKPNGDTPEVLAATGTHGKRISERFAVSLPCAGDGMPTGGCASPGGSVDDQAAIVAMLSLAKNRDSGESVRVDAGVVRRKAPPGFEPGMEVLQTSALPLGYGAATRSVWLDPRSDRILQPSQREGTSNLTTRRSGSKSTLSRGSLLACREWRPSVAETAGSETRAEQEGRPSGKSRPRLDESSDG